MGHGLDAAPDLVIIKSYNTTSNWIVYSSPTGNGKYLYLTASSAQSANWFDTSATTFTLNNTYGDANTSGRNYIAYNFTSKPGFSKVGSYTGNNVTNNIQTGFEPAFLLIKNTTSTNNWIIVDNKRSPVNQRKQILRPNTADSEITATVNINFLANGFQLTNGNSDVNDGGATYIYLAIAADGSTATPSLANSFATEIYSGNGGTQSITGTGFKPDFTWIKARTGMHFGIYYKIQLEAKVKHYFQMLQMLNQVMQTI